MTTPFPPDDVVRLALPHRHRLVEQVRDQQQQAIELTAQLVSLRCQSFDLVGHLLQLCEDLLVLGLRVLLGEHLLSRTQLFGLRQRPQLSLRSCYRLPTSFRRSSNGIATT